jgi:RNA polymerase sigma-70 factor, ECF subfamily
MSEPHALVQAQDQQMSNTLGRGTNEALGIAPMSFSQRLVAIIPALRAFARGLCGRADLADDLAQEALTKAWAARVSYLPNTNFKAWMFTILRNHYYSWCRKQRRVAPWDPDAAERLLVCEPSQPGHMELAELAAGMQMLPAQQREALVLVGAGGFTYEEAADIVGCAVGTVKSRVARGRTALRDFLETRQTSLGAARPTGAEASASIFEELNRLDRKTN